MTPFEIRSRRIELGLTPDELAFALGLGLTAQEIRLIEEGSCDIHRTAEFREAFERLEERVFATIAGAPLFA